VRDLLRKGTDAVKQISYLSVLIDLAGGKFPLSSFLSFLLDGNNAPTGSQSRSSQAADDQDEGMPKVRSFDVRRAAVTTLSSSFTALQI
jgi:hypothetical protein